VDLEVEQRGNMGEGDASAHEGEFWFRPPLRFDPSVLLKIDFHPLFLWLMRALLWL
jgi:hypothetical protein